jgi:hypothetical protein
MTETRHGETWLPFCSERRWRWARPWHKRRRPERRRPPDPPLHPPPRRKAGAKTPLVDINTASKDELDKLPGIGPARAEIIIKNRPYSGKDELRRKKVLPDSVYEGIRERIIARQS